MSDEAFFERMADDVAERLQKGTKFYDAVERTMKKFGVYRDNPETKSYYCKNIGRILGARRKQQQTAR